MKGLLINKCQCHPFSYEFKHSEVAFLKCSIVHNHLNELQCNRFQERADMKEGGSIY